jgi:hypothetical protein
MIASYALIAFLLIGILFTAHHTWVTSQQMKILNNKIDEFIEIVKSK